MKQALILIGGIAQEAYAKKELLDSEFSIHNYDLIEEFDYEFILDALFSWIPFYDVLKNLDRHGDWLQFLISNKKRNQIRNNLKTKIELLQGQGYEIDILCHSLGTWIAWGTDITINHFISIASPISSRNILMRLFSKSEIKERIKKKKQLKAKSIDYLYNKEDIVSSKAPPMDIITATVRHATSIFKYRVLELGSGHGLKQYLNEYRKVTNEIQFNILDTLNLNPFD